MNPSLSFAIVGLATAMLGAAPPLRATTAFSGNAGNLGNDQFAHPAPRSYAFVDLLAARAHQPLSVLKITSSGKILLGMGARLFPGESDGRVVGYIWDRGEFSEICAPAWPWLYGSLDPDPFISFTVTDMNDAGVVVGECRGTFWPAGWPNAISECIGVIWPAGHLANPKELHAGVATPAARFNRPYPDGGPYFADFRGIRIDDTGTCYGVGSARDFYLHYYKEDVIRWAGTDALPESLTQNALPGLFKNSFILDVSPGGNVFFLTRDYPTGALQQELVRRDPPGRQTLSLAQDYAHSGVTESGIVFSWQTWPSKKIFARDASGETTTLAGSYPSHNYAGDVLAQHARSGSRMLWTWRQTGGGTAGYFPRYPYSTRGPLLQDSHIRLGPAGQFGGTGVMYTNLQGVIIPPNERYRPMLLLPASLTVDADRDGDLDEADEGRTYPLFPLRWGSNHDDDAPGTTPQADYLNNTVDGTDDLADFLPLFLDLRKLFDALPPSSGHCYKLKQADGGLNFAYTTLTRATAFNYLTDTASTYGPNADQAAAVATTQQITAAGVELSADFLTRIKEQDQGVILLELRGMTSAPLRLVVEKDGTEIAEVAVNIATGEAKFEALANNAPLSDNKNRGTGAWMPGKGVRIFPDARTNTDTTPRNQVYAKVGLAGATGSVTLRIIDVDDPSPSAVPTDPDYQHLVDPNDATGERGDDNTGDLGGGRSAVFAANNSNELTCAFGSDGYARINGQYPVINVSMRPGDNYRLVVVQTAADLNPLQVTNPTGTGYVAPSSAQPRGFKGLASEMLTVWRKLHVEQDTMAAVAVSGPEQNIESASLDSITSIGGKHHRLNLDVNLPGGDNRFEGGYLSTGISSFQIISHENTLLAGADVVVLDNAAGHMAARYASGLLGTATLVDDDGQNIPTHAILPISPSVSFITAYVLRQYAPSYIEPDDSQPNPNRVVPFLLNRTPPNPVPRDLTDRPEFWAIRLIAAFQSSTNEDADPDDGSSNSIFYKESLTTGEYNSGDVYIHMEGIRDDIIGHGPNPGGQNDGNADHAEGGLMSDQEVAPFREDMVFESQTIKRFRKATTWSE
jgi:hypothetical protein